MKEEEAEIDRDIDELLDSLPSPQDRSSPLTPVEEDSYIEPGQEEEEEEEEVNELLVEDS